MDTEAKDTSYKDKCSGCEMLISKLGFSDMVGHDCRQYTLAGLWLNNRSLTEALSMLIAVGGRSLPLEYTNSCAFWSIPFVSI